MPDRIVPSTWGARSTSHAIVVEEPPSIWRGGWLLQGGLLGREELAEGTVELFGKGNVRLHWPYDSKLGQDHSWDFVLVVRPKKSQGAKVIRRWHFNPEEVVLAVPPETAADIRRTATSEDEAIKLINKQKSNYLVAGLLKVDPVRRVATVSITGMVHCVEERIDLAPSLSRTPAAQRRAVRLTFDYARQT
jgi:hypothetical protein